MDIDKLKEILKKDSMQEAVLIGSEDEREKYYPAIVECDEKKGIVVYDYDLLAECFANDFFDPSEPNADYGKAMEEAVEWIDYNVIRSLPYWGEHAPVVRENNEEE